MTADLPGPSRPATTGAPGTGAVRIAVLDSRPIVATGLAQLLREWGGFDVVTVHAGEVGMLEALARAPADVILIGIEDGVTSQAMSMLREAIASTDAHVVALVSSVEVEVMSEILAAGADSVVFTKSDYDELAAALIALRARSRVSVTADLSELVRNLMAGSEQPRKERAQLSQREREVLRAIVDGRSTKRIAADLGLSTNTVRTHVQKILRKLDAHSRLEAAAIALDQNLLS
jgi:two-component system nitrate/nitrite response regulator NarL